MICANAFKMGLLVTFGRWIPTTQLINSLCSTCVLPYDLTRSICVCPVFCVVHLLPIGILLSRPSAVVSTVSLRSVLALFAAAAAAAAAAREASSDEST